MSRSSETSLNFPLRIFDSSGWGSANSPCGNPLRQPKRLDCFVQPQDQLGLEVLLFGIGEPELQPDVPGGSLAAGIFVIVAAPLSMLIAPAAADAGQKSHPRPRHRHAPAA